MKESNQYILSAIMGKEYCTAAYMLLGGKPEILDRTGGYGSLDNPLSLAWLRHEKRFVIYDDVMALMPEEGIIVHDLMERCLSGKSLTLEGHTYRPAALVCIYLQKLFATLLEVNPKANIEGIRLAFDLSMDSGVLADILRGLEETYECHVYIPSSKSLGLKAGELIGPITKGLWLGLEINEDQLMLKAFTPDSEEVFYNEVLGIEALKQGFERLLSKGFLAYTDKKELSLLDQHHIKVMVNGHFQSLFIRAKDQRPLKLTFNHIFPPFQVKIGPEDLQSMTQEVHERLIHLARQIESFWPDYRIYGSGIGFRQPWVQALMESNLGDRLTYTWSSRLYALLQMVEERAPEPWVLESDVALLFEGNEATKLIGRKGQAYDSVHVSLDLVITGKDPYVRLYDMDSFSGWRCIYEKKIELPEQSICLQKVTFWVDVKGVWQVDNRQVPL